jgi:uncharacterized protein
MSEIHTDVERRACGECRVDLLEDRKIRGYAIVFNKPSENMGGFREVIRPDAVERTFKEAIDVRALVDHDSSKIIGRLSAGTLRLQRKQKGLWVEIDPPNTSAARDIVESIDRRDVTGMSFAFQVIEDDWSEVDKMPMREILDMRFNEISVVTFPAYDATSVQVAQRSLQQFKASHHPRNDRWREQWHEIQVVKQGLG